MLERVPPQFRELQEITMQTDTRDILAHATRQAESYEDYFLVDIDAHVTETPFWPEIIGGDRQRGDPPDGRGRAGASRQRQRRAAQRRQPGMLYQHVYGRIPHQQALLETVEKNGVHHFTELARRSMDAMGLDYQIVFPTPMLTLGMHPQDDIEVALGAAYNKWLVERILPEDDRLKGLIYLPFNTPEACVEEVKKYADVDSIIGYHRRARPATSRCITTTTCSSMRMMEETGKPFAFHSGFNWNDPSFLQLNRFISMHALSFVHYSLIHMTNWIINGLPERFPKLKLLWVESGLAWIPFLMQRLDHEYQMRTCEAPMLKRLPSEYMREMYLHEPAAGEDQPEAAPGDDGGVQRRHAAAVRVGLAALGLRRAELDHHAAVPHRAGQAQHPRAERRAHLQSRGQAQAAAGEGRAGGAAGRVLTMAVSVQPKAAGARRAISSPRPSARCRPASRARCRTPSSSAC